MSKKAKIVLIIEIIICIVIVLYGISLIVIKNKTPKYDTEVENKDETIYKEAIEKYIQTMKTMKNYTLSIQVSNNFDKSYNKTTKYQIDDENQKVLDATNVKYYNLNENKYQYYENGRVLEKEYTGELAQLNIFNTNIFHKPFKVKMKNDQYILTYSKDDTAVLNFIKNFIDIEGKDITKLEIILRVGKTNINSINMNYTFQDNNSTYEGNIQIIYSEINRTEIIMADKLEYLAKMQLLEQKELKDSFTIKLNGKNHTIDVIYCFSLYEEDNEFITTAFLKYDGKKIDNYSYDIFLKVNDIDTLLNYRITDLKEKISKDDFYVIKGENNEEYIGIYSYIDFPAGYASNLIIINEQGNEIISIEAAGSTTIENYAYDDFYWHTKINENSINFLACEDRYNMNTDDNARVITEYQLILGEKLSFELINKYNDGILAGGGGGYINDIIPNEDTKQD